ncbi:hypothetical protein ACH5RR_040395 [Cinchona calisaya]|uniref:Disease resistance protein RPM1-like n=1 Tax=Cinchona calisaya TaxID=153742 RepID=A0ABD2XSN1_9GENT
MADTVLSFVLDQLASFLIQKGNLLGGLKQEVQYISDELGQMKAFLKVAEAKEDDDAMLREWIKKLREVAYDIEDVLDEFMFLFPRHHASGLSGCLKKICNRIKNVPAHHSIANEIKDIKSRITNIFQLYEKYKSIYGTSHHFLGSYPTSNTWWDDALRMEKEKLVGIEMPKQLLISQLLGGDSRLKVISVVGKQGLGKTTLVKEVHRDADVRKQFQISAWVPASQTRDIKELLKDLIRQIYEQIKKPIVSIVESITNIDKLKSSLRDLLQGKRYAIVFDDVRDTDFWNSIKSALPENSCGSRVMLTTQIPDVAQASGLESQGYVYRMTPLPFEESWTLFCDKAFKDNHCPTHLKTVAQDILRKCKGFPLAIVALGGFLALKDESKVDEWEMVQHSLEGEEDTVNKIFYLSYKDLPSHINTCLLYMSIFPDDYEIQCHRLIQLWIAERFVEGKGQMTTEEVAMGYLKELVRRSLVQVTQKSPDGSPDHCCIRDVVRGIILCKSQEQNLITIASQLHTRDREKVHRLVIHNSPPNTQRSNYFNHLRSLITFGSIESLPKTLFSDLLSSKLLKVLDFSDAHLEEIPNEVFNLFLLKYLCLRGTRVKIVPKSIKKLQNLEHLHLGETNVRALPMEILKLPKLRHLRAFQVVDSSDVHRKWYGFKAPSNIGGLNYLHSLLFIEAQNDKTTIIREIGKLSNLRELGITKLGREDGKDLCSSIAKLNNLQQLDVTAIGEDEVIDINHSVPSSSLQFLRVLSLRCRLEKLPHWINSLQSLMKIELIWSKLRDDDPLETLQHLPNLVEVCLSQAYDGEGLYFQAGKFLKLDMLVIENMQGLKWMAMEEGAMPHLRSLHMSELPQLKELPEGIQHLRELQSLHLSDMSSELTEKLQNPNDETGDYRNIVHIPKIVIA